MRFDSEDWEGGVYTGPDFGKSLTMTKEEYEAQNEAYRSQKCTCGCSRRLHRHRGIVPNCTGCEDAGKMCRGFEIPSEVKP
jgi:hypothetical protein